MDRVGLSVGAGLGFIFLQPLAYLQTSQVLAIDHHSILSTSSAGWLNTCGLSRPETVCGLMDLLCTCIGLRRIWSWSVCQPGLQPASAQPWKLLAMIACIHVVWLTADPCVDTDINVEGEKKIKRTSR